MQWLAAVVLYGIIAVILQTAFNFVVGLLGFAIMAPGIMAEESSQRPRVRMLLTGWNWSLRGLLGMAVSLANLFGIFLVTAYLGTVWTAEEKTLWVLATLWGGAMHGWIGLILMGLVAVSVWR